MKMKIKTNVTKLCNTQHTGTPCDVLNSGYDTNVTKKKFFLPSSFQQSEFRVILNQ